MSEAIEVYAFNVRFGDAILVRVPDKNKAGGGTTIRHILIDVGNTLAAAVPKNEPMPAKPGGADDVLPPAVEQILQVLGGASIDLYVMTHEHLDHVQGLPYADAKRAAALPKLRDLLKPKFVWMTASAEGDAYYQRHKEAKRQKKALALTLATLDAHLWAAGNGRALAGLAPVLINNSPTFTGPCVEWLKKLVPPGRKPTYLHRESKPADVAKAHPFEEATFEIWAPEEDTSVYYGRMKPMALASGAASATGVPPSVRVTPPAGVDAEAFLNLVDLRRRGVAENLFEIDKAANNTSLVFCLEWRGRKLLFAGDAEEKSWAMMRKQGVLEPVDFLKVAHHGSSNGTPADDILDLVLPIGVAAATKSKRIAMVSTWEHTYGGIPNSPTNNQLTARCGKFVTTIDDPDQPYVKVTIPPA